MVPSTFLPFLILFISFIPSLDTASTRRDEYPRKCIGGEKCDQCDRGFYQQAERSIQHPVLSRIIPPGETQQCQECGECFSRWDDILDELRAKTEDQVRRAEQVKITGATGAYSVAFEKMENDLGEIKEILASASISNDELLNVQERIDGTGAILSETEKKLKLLDSEVANIKTSIVQEDYKLTDLKLEAENLEDKALDMKKQITMLQESNVKGALNLTREAKNRAEEARIKVETIQSDGGDLKNSELQRTRTERKIELKRAGFKDSRERNEKNLDEIIMNIDNLAKKLPNVTNKVCDGFTTVDEPCDSLCGGAGCGKCGGLSCLNGALSKASDAVRQSENAAKILNEKKEEGEAVLYGLRHAQQTSEAAERQAQLAYNKANQAMNVSTAEVTRVTEVQRSIDEFQRNSTITPENVKQLAEECMEKDLDLDNASIQELADQINTAISGVSNVEQILEDTDEDLAKARELRQEAVEVQTEAQTQLDKVNNITGDLGSALEAQYDADQNIQRANADIDSARENLSKIQHEMDEAMSAADQSVSDVEKLSRRQEELATKYIKNENRVADSKAAAESARKQADDANDDFYKLNTEFKAVSNDLNNTSATIGSAKVKALDLQERAQKLANDFANKLNLLVDIEKDFEENEKRLLELSSQLVGLNCEMKVQLEIIMDKSNFYRTCSPSVGPWQAKKICTCNPSNPEPDCVEPQRI